MTASMGEIYLFTKAHALFRVIRGELCVFKTPPEINGDMYPTDHGELLDKALYPMAEKYPAAWVQRTLDIALRAAPSDALGTFCAIQCYYMQIAREDRETTPFQLDRVSLSRFLTARYFENLEGMKTLQIVQYDQPPATQKLALAYLELLGKNHGVKLTT